MSLYYKDDFVELYHGDCLTEHREWLDADVLVTDPPYGRNWSSSGMKGGRRPGGALRKSAPREGIQGDKDTQTRDKALKMWGGRVGVCFGDLMLKPPKETRQVLVYVKPGDAGIRGTTAGFRRDVEAVYLVGPWSSGISGRSSVLTTGARQVGGPIGVGTVAGHPHAKPLDLLEVLVSLSPGVVADPFAGSASTLVAAKRLGRKAIGVELEERYCEIAANRLSQGVLPLWEGGGAA